MSNSSINCMDVINEYVAIGCGNGVVQFYDFSLRIEAWFEDIFAGPVTSLSFSLMEPPYVDKNIAGEPGLRFWAPDFVIGTSDAYIVAIESECFHQIQAEDRRGVLLLQGLKDDVTAAACHPKTSFVVIATYCGVLQTWDYYAKKLALVRDFNDGDDNTLSRSRSAKKLPPSKDHVFMRPTCLAFEPSAEFLAVGFSSGIIKFLHSKTLDDLASFAPSTSPILQLQFSVMANYLGAYDASNHVLLFGRISEIVNSVSEINLSDTRRKTKFEYIGRIHAHSASIVGLAFGIIQGSEILVSIAKDKRIVEYDCEKSTASEGVFCYGEGKLENRAIRVELTATPSAIMWPEPNDEVSENKFIIANDHYKLRELNADTNKCRKVTNCPLIGGYPSTLLTLPLVKDLIAPDLLDTLDVHDSDMSEDGGANRFDMSDEELLTTTAESNLDQAASAEIHQFSEARRHFVYAAEERSIGVGCLPLTGNPNLVNYNPPLKTFVIFSF